MKHQITESVYSRDNHDKSLCAVGDGNTCWVAWSAYGSDGSRCFTRRFDGRVMNDIEPLSPANCMQTQPLCLPLDDRVVFVWYEKENDAYRVCRRGHDGAQFSSREVLVDLPRYAKPGELEASIDANGELWLAWSQAEKGASVIAVWRVAPDGTKTGWRLTAGGERDYRPRLEVLAGGGAYVVWDAYGAGGYDVYGCGLSAKSPSPVVRISRDSAWETRPALCRDNAGRLWCVWVRCKDVIWKDSVIHQKFSVRGAIRDGNDSDWRPLTGIDSGADIAPLHYGLLTDFDRKPPCLGHQGRRLRPMLRAAEDGGVWLFYEVKMDDSLQTLDSLGRLFVQRSKNGEWSAPLNVAEGLVHYELPHNRLIGKEVFLIGRASNCNQPSENVDELYLWKAPIHPALPEVTADRRTVDLTHWREIDLPLPCLVRLTGERTRLPGPARGRFQLIWGDFHVHAEGSVECEGALDELANYARDKSGLQALTISDNDNFWSFGVRGNQRRLTDFEWDTNLGNAKVLNAPGCFALFPGYEQTIGAQHGTSPPRQTRNHTSVMADADEMERDRFEQMAHYLEAVEKARRCTGRDVVECVRWAKEKGYYPLPHAHHNWWRLVDQTIQTCCDVTTAWMRNIEEYDIYHRYLNEWKQFGFTGSSDGHYRNPGLGGAVTGLWVTEVSRPAVLEALRARRVYATAGQRILIEFAINETFMGDLLVVDEDPVIRWRVVGEDGEDYTLRVLRDGRRMYETPFTGNTEGEIVDKRLTIHRPGQHYYYLEIESAKVIPDYPANAAHALGGKAWSTPVWLETADWEIWTGGGN